MNLPFSISDLIERVIPGGILQGYVLFFVFGVNIGPIVANFTLAVIVAYASTSYAIGVLLNALASWANPADNRVYWQGAATDYKHAVRKSFEDYFGFPATEDSWRFCYGICAKHGYAANTQLFQGLYVFCRSMVVNCVFGAVLLTFGLFIGFPQQSSPGYTLVTILASLCAAGIFYLGVWTYTRSFVGSIYEGFFTWHQENHVKSRSTVS